MLITTPQWSATYDKKSNAWTSRYANVERFLNRKCVPDTATDAAARDAVQVQFPNLAMEVTENTVITHAESLAFDTVAAPADSVKGEE